MVARKRRLGWYSTAFETRGFFGHRRGQIQEKGKRLLSRRGGLERPRPVSWEEKAGFTVLFFKKESKRRRRGHTGEERKETLRRTSRGREIVRVRGGKEVS